MNDRIHRPRALIIVTALLLDLILGDPPNRFHPVAWIGSFIGAAQRHAPCRSASDAPDRGRLPRLAYGGLIAVGGVLGTFGLARVAQRMTTWLPAPLGLLLESALLKTSFSVHRLGKVSRQIETALASGNVPKARRLVSWHLVSRDTSRLTPDQVAAATIESVAESASDGIMAPLLAYSVFGLPGAMVYRFSNTADSMLGYRDAAREWLGKVPARLDDALNLVPARFTALLLIVGSALVGENAWNAFRVWLRDNGKTTSPNAGHPMSAMAGALEVELEKVGRYRLGEGQRSPSTADIGSAARVVYAAVALGTALLVGLSLLVGGGRRD